MSGVVACSDDLDEECNSVLDLFHKWEKGWQHLDQQRISSRSPHRVTNVLNLPIEKFEPENPLTFTDSTHLSDVADAVARISLATESDDSGAATESDSDSDQSDREITVGVYCREPVASRSACMQLLEGYIFHHLCGDLKSMFSDTYRCKKSDEAAAKLLDDCVAEGLIPAPPGNDRSSPAIRALKDLVEKGWPEEKGEKLQAWRVFCRNIEDETKFIELVNKWATEGLFSVKQALDKRSFVGLLRMRTVAAQVIRRVLTVVTGLKEELWKAGIECMVFGDEGLGAVSMKPGGLAIPRRQAAECCRKLRALDLIPDLWPRPPPPSRSLHVPEPSVGHKRPPPPSLSQVLLSPLFF